LNFRNWLGSTDDLRWAEIVLVLANCPFLHEEDLKADTVFLHLSEFVRWAPEQAGNGCIAIYFQFDVGRKAKTTSGCGRLFHCLLCTGYITHEAGHLGS